MHLDHSDPITRDHMGPSWLRCARKLFQFLQAEPHNSLGKAARRPQPHAARPYDPQPPLAKPALSRVRWH